MKNFTTHLGVHGPVRALFPRLSPVSAGACFTVLHPMRGHCVSMMCVLALRERFHLNCVVTERRMKKRARNTSVALRHGDAELNILVKLFNTTGFALSIDWVMTHL